MPRSAAKQVVLSLPRVPAEAVAVGTTIVGFGALLLEDQVPALLVYCLQLFLAA